MNDVRIKLDWIGGSMAVSGRVDEGLTKWVSFGQLVQKSKGRVEVLGICCIHAVSVVTY